MHLSIPMGTTSKIIQIPIFDSSSTVGAMLAGLVYNSGSLTGYYNREGAAGAATAITLATATKGTWATGGFIAVDGTNMPGWYELHIPDAALASGAKSVSIHLKGATNMVPVPVIIELTATSNQDAVRGGMTALPNANAEAAGGLYTRGTGAGQINQPANGQVDANTVKVGGTVQTAKDLGASATQTGDAYARLGSPAGASVSADVAAVKTDTGNIYADTHTNGVVIPQAQADKVWSTPTRALTDKAGFSLTQTFPTNFSALAITAGGAVTAGTVSDKTGYSISGTKATLDALNDITAASVWSVATRLLTAGTNIVLAKGTGVTGFNDIAATDVWAAAARSLTDKSGFGLSSLESAVLHTGTAQAGAAGSITLAAGASAAADLYKGLRVRIYGGTGVGQSRMVTGYNGGTKVATVDWNWITIPDATSTYAVIDADGPAVNSSLQVATTASDPWNTALPGSYGAGTAGYIIGTNLNATISSRMPSGNVTVGTNLDKTGYTLTQAFPANFSLLSINASGYVTYANDPWGAALPGTYGAGSAGYILGTNLNATVGSRSAPATAQTIDLTTAVSTFTGKPGTIGQLLYFIRQNAQNKLDFNKTLNNMVLYEDDGVTAKMTYAMTDNANDAIRGAGA